MYPGANSTRNIQITLYNPQQYIDPTNGAGNQSDVWNTGNLPISLNASPSIGQVSGTLVVPWPYASGTYSSTFTGVTSGSTGTVSQTLNVTFTKGSTAVSFGTALAYTNLSATFLVSGLNSGGMGCDSPIIMDTRCIELGASWWCLQERGESLGAGSMFSEERYRQALDDLIGADRNKQGDLIMIPG
jgi:hypothetical protein